VAKDPAILFYTSDFLVGTMTMNNEQVGKYIRALCIQHQQGHMDEDKFTQIVGNDKEVRKKFRRDRNLMWYNSRLEEECNKRSEFVKSRLTNLKSKRKKLSHMGPHMESHMGPHMEDEDEDEDPIQEKINIRSNYHI
jgi:hypothetical protein